MKEPQGLEPHQHGALDPFDERERGIKKITLRRLGLPINADISYIMKHV